MPFIRPEEQMKMVMLYHPRRTGARNPRQGGDTPSYTASISPSSTTQYENVILSGSTDLTNPVFVWTLTDFYDTTDTLVSSYTGQTLTEGYFTSSGSSNVVLDVTGDEGTAQSSTFSVSAFDPASLNPDMWLDFSDTSTMSLRVDGGTTYIESIDNKGTTSSYLTGYSETIASRQPILSPYNGSTAMTLDAEDGEGMWLNGIDYNFMTGFTGSNLTQIAVVYNDVTSSPSPNLGIQSTKFGQIVSEGRTTAKQMRFYMAWEPNNNRFAFDAGQILPVGNWIQLYTTGYTGDFILVGEMEETSVVSGLQNFDVRFSDWNTDYVTSGTTTGIQGYTFPQEFNYPGQIHRTNSRNASTDLYDSFTEPYAEGMFFTRILSDNEKNALKRYLKVKWSL